MRCKLLRLLISSFIIMELNVCSRRVHDGYATIRTRGRSRPRAVYRSDSEELLKEANGPYAPSEMSSIVPPTQGTTRIPRWYDAGKDSFGENYGTLKASPRRGISLDEGQGLGMNDGIPILNTFASKVKPRRQSSGAVNSKTTGSRPSFVVETEVAKTMYNLSSTSKDDNLQVNQCNDDDAVLRSQEPCEFGGNKEESLASTADGNSKNNKRTPGNKTRQPIYAIPNVPRLNNKPPRIPRDHGVDGNYVPSGDLYRSTARYIEDLNKNIAKIDKNYADTRSSMNNRNSTYGIINKISKSEIENSSKNLYGTHRKRDMAPMPPISPNFGEPSEERELEFKIPNGKSLPKKTAKSRPNSYGKLPPKVLPRSSSIENASSSRNSNGSSSSAKSTESLYAISEALTGLSKSRVTFQEPNVSRSNFGMVELASEAYHTLPAKRSAFKNRKDRAKPLRNSGEDILGSKLTNGAGRSSTLDRSPRKNLETEEQDDENTLDDVFLDNNSPGSSSSGKTDSQSAKKMSSIYRRHSARSHEDILGDTLNVEASYGTLPSRKPKGSLRALHKSSEDVLDCVRDSRPDSENLGRGYKSTVDLGAPGAQLVGTWARAVPVCLMDATDVIINGQLQRSKELLSSENEVEDSTTASMDTVDHYAMLQAEFRGEAADLPSMMIDANVRKSNRTRTRHNSLELDADPTLLTNTNTMNYATLPRRRVTGNKSDQESCDFPKRLSGTLPVLEPLYEHAVSDPVKPRNSDNIIPWWELATRKYRHRSCPSLQAHVVSAFEQSLSNMTQRLQHLTATAEKKDSELQELRDTIERLRKQSAEAGLNATNQSASTNGRRHTLGDSESTTGCTGSNSNHQGSSIARQLSADSVTSLNSLSSACSASSHHKKKGWLRSSFSKAFSRSRKNRHGSVSDAEDCKDGPGELSAPNSPRLPTAAKHESRNQAPSGRNNGQRSPENENGLTGSKSSSALYKKDDEDVDELKKQLREKDMVLTDIRLEALSSAHQLESLKDTVIKMRNEMLNLKQNNERLQRLVTSKSLTSSQSSLPSDPERRFSMTEVASSVAAMSSGGNPQGSDQLEDMTVLEHPVVQSAPATTTTNEPPMEQDTDGKRINVAVYLGSERSFNSNIIGSSSSEGNSEPPHCIIASVCISNKTSWDSLDATVRRCFKEYVARVDPVTNLGLGIECVAAYHLGEASRCTSDSHLPELLPCGYLVGHVRTIYLVLSGYSWLAVDTLIPRSIVQRLVSLLTEHRRVILCGPSGTGKSYLAGKLAHALVDADTEAKDAASVATFNVDHKSSKELRQYLAHIAERCDSSAADELPRVIILENLQHAASLGELFSGLLGTRHSSCPAIIGTMSQATCSTTNLQLHHNFRWVLCANHMEPVKGFLGRYLRRRLLEHELRESGGSRNAEMAGVVEWIPRVWLHLNKFLETHSSSDVTIGPRLFLSCPMEVAGSQVWFTDVWNYSVVPYLVDAVREGLTLYGRRISGNGNGDSPWEDPAHFITSSYPWVATHAVHGGSDALRRMRPEDVGYDVVTSGHNSGVGASSVKSLGSTHSDTEGDPLLNMLMRLQEAANYSSPHSNDSDSVTSLDSSHTRHSEDLTCSSSTSSSRGVESTL